MEHFAGADLHGRNTMVGITDEKDNRVFKKRFPNYLPVILSALEPYKNTLVGIAVESTFNWYVMAAGGWFNGSGLSRGFSSSGRNGQV
jgi:transposase